MKITKQIDAKLKEQKGQSILLMTFFILLIFSAIAAREIMVSSFSRGISQNAIEDRMARDLAQSGTLEALDKIRRLDSSLDQNGDGQIDSRDGDYITRQDPNDPNSALAYRNLGSGKYKYLIRANYSNQRTFYFRIVEDCSQWTSAKIKIQEGTGITNSWSDIGQIRIDCNTSKDGSYTVSAYPGDYDYQITADIRHSAPGSENIWVRVVNYNQPLPFSTLNPQTLATDANGTFPSSAALAGSPDTATGTIDWHEVTKLVQKTDVLGARAFAQNTFTLISTGVEGSQRYNTEYQVIRDDLLKYAFFSDTDLVFLGGAIINGYVYARTGITLLPSVPAAPTIFTRLVRVVIDAPHPWTDRITDSSCGTFAIGTVPRLGGTCQGDFTFGGVGGEAVDLPQTSSSRDVALERGWVVSGDVTLNLDQFICNKATQAATWNNPLGISSHSTPTSGHFEGIIYVDGNVTIKGGRLKGCGLTIVAGGTSSTEGNLTIDNSVYTGLDNKGEPVNLGLVAKDWIYISQTAPKILHINAAILARNQTIMAQPAIDTHVCFAQDANDTCLNGTDRDADGQIGCATAVSPNDPNNGCTNTTAREVGVYDIDGDDDALDIESTSNNGFGWDETSVTPVVTSGGSTDTWFLLIRGPIILGRTGSAGPWAALGNTIFAGTGKSTRSYQYDPDITRYPPPHFPLPLNATRILSVHESNKEEDLVPDPTPTPIPAI